MITEGFPKSLPKIEDAAFIKACCSYAAYKDFKNIAQFYHGIKDNELYAIIAKVSDYISLWYAGGCDEELLNFLKFTGYSGIFTSLETALRLNLNINEKCFVFKAEPPFSPISSTENSQPRELLNILRQGLTIPNGDEFVADVSFRVMHDCADYVTHCGGGALLFYESDSAIINGIAVPKNRRGKGLGSTVIKMLLSKAKNRSVYACCVEKNKPFYIKNGFTLIGEAAYCEEE